MSAAERDEWGEEFARMSDPKGTTAERLAYLIDQAALVGDMRDDEWVKLAQRCFAQADIDIRSILDDASNLVREAGQ